MILDNPYNKNAIFKEGNSSQGFNFFGMERSYLEGRGFTFANGEAIYPSNQPTWHPPMPLPSNTNNN